MRHIRSFQDIDVFLHPPGNLFVDKTKNIIDLLDKYLVLRPPQFGKTMFLSTLYHFYDIQGKPQFDERFGSLAVVTQAPTPVRHSQHLCLFFNLSGFWVDPALPVLAPRLSNQFSRVLRSFLVKYATELKLSDPYDYLEDEDLNRPQLDPAVILSLLESIITTLPLEDSVLLLTTIVFRDVRRLYAPTRDRTSSGFVFLEAFDGCQRCHRQAMGHRRLVNYPSFKTLAPNALLASTAFAVLPRRRLSILSAQSLLHPRLLINQILELSLPDAPVDEDSFELLSAILEALPEEPDTAGAAILGLYCNCCRGSFVASLDDSSAEGTNANLHGVFELIVRNSRVWRRDVDPIVLQSLECIQVPAYLPDKEALSVGLKTLTLRGMWQAGCQPERTTSRRWKLLRRCINLKEDELLARPYTVWSPTRKAVKTVRVGNFFDSDAPENPRFLAVGGAPATEAGYRGGR
ncbi:hypothetical protein K438DRAFT_1926450 [Mycena galopus ATCC 62051]|nr:hypothetical protein K438DRAFT_1926450 [Mycena galopus ATCC 62051]